MGCLLKFILFFLVIPFIWNALIVPLFTAKAGGTRPQANQLPPKERYLAFLMPLLAKIAKADGRVSESEISLIELIFNELNLSQDERQFAKQTFNSAKDAATSFEAYLFQFARAGYDFEVRVLTYQFMIRVAGSDNHLSGQEQQMLAHAGLCLGIPREMIIAFLQRFAGFNAHAHRSSAASPGQREQDLALLGLKKNASADEIKKAYRQKVKELHPDRLHAQGLPEAMLKEANERMAAINAAYDRLTK